MDLLSCFLECTSRLDFNFSLSWVFITPSKSTMQNLRLRLRVWIIGEHRCGKIYNQNALIGPGLSFVAAYSMSIQISCTLSVSMRLLGKFSSVSVWSHRGIEDMDKVFVRKWKINQCCLLIAWFCIWLSFRMIGKLMRKLNFILEVFFGRENVWKHFELISNALKLQSRRPNVEFPIGSHCSKFLLKFHL